jgi:large subunit ribosomal protein L21
MTIVIQSGSKQYSVVLGQTIIVDFLKGVNEGDTVALDIIHAYGGDSTDGVVGIIQKHQRGEKIRVVKYLPKSNYHRQYGARQEETVLLITNGEAPKAAAVKAKTTKTKAAK